MLPAPVNQKPGECRPARRPAAVRDPAHRANRTFATKLPHLFLLAEFSHEIRSKQELARATRLQRKQITKACGRLLTLSRKQDAPFSCPLSPMPRNSYLLGLHINSCIIFAGQAPCDTDTQTHTHNSHTPCNIVWYASVHLSGGIRGVALIQ